MGGGSRFDPNVLPPAVMNGTPMEGCSKLAQLALGIRRRKGLKIEMPKLEDYYASSLSLVLSLFGFADSAFFSHTGQALNGLPSCGHLHAPFSVDKTCYISPVYFYFVWHDSQCNTRGVALAFSFSNSEVLTVESADSVCATLSHLL